MVEQCALERTGRRRTGRSRRTSRTRRAVEVGAHTIKLTNLDKVLIPAKRPHKAVTKRDLIRHYAAIAPAILPYLADRPINLHRYPDGIEKAGVLAQSTTYPRAGLAAVVAQRGGGPRRDRGLLGARQRRRAGLGRQLRRHRTAPVDVDHRPPSPSDLGDGRRRSRHIELLRDVVALANLHRTALAHLGVDARPKLTGRRGIQIWIPVARRYSFDETRAWVEQLSRIIGGTVPEHGELAMGEVQTQGFEPNQSGRLAPQTPTLRSAMPRTRRYARPKDTLFSSVLVRRLVALLGRLCTGRCCWRNEREW